MKQIRKRLTYANVMSSIAVFLVLGGATAFAASKIGANQLKANSVKTGKIVKEAVTTGKIKNGAVDGTKLADNSVTTSKIADNAVTTAKIADNAVNSGKIAADAVNGAKLAENSVGTGKLVNEAVTGAKANEATFGQVPSAKVAESASNVLWAVVSNPSGAANATLVRSTQPAPTVTESVGVIVAFDRNISNCVWSVTRGTPGEGVETAGFVEVGGAAGNPNAVDVRARDEGGTITDGSFHLIVICP
ncbi:MAG TPA: hypothetical protein VFJ61_09380 [Solirubrobacterales bacterium]|nr:hypothetical protein [Solirubrobacterales bacterium]